MVVLSMYFKKRRAISAGLAIAGGSAGSVVMPWVFEAVVNEYGYTGAMMIMAGLLLNAIPAALLLRPISTFLPLSAQRQQRAAMASVSLATTMKGLCAKVFDKELITSGFFLYVVMLMAMAQIGFMMCMLFAPLAVREIPSQTDLVVLTPVLMGTFELFGRILVGIVADKEKIPKNVVMGGTTIIPGTILIACILPIHLGVVAEAAQPYLAMLAISVMGLLGGAYLSLLTPVLTHYFGILKLPSTVGLCTFAMGILLIPFPILMGE